MQAVHFRTLDPDEAGALELAEQRWGAKVAEAFPPLEQLKAALYEEDIARMAINGGVKWSGHKGGKVGSPEIMGSIKYLESQPGFSDRSVGVNQRFIVIDNLYSEIVRHRTNVADDAIQVKASTSWARHLPPTYRSPLTLEERVRPPQASRASQGGQVTRVGLNRPDNRPWAGGIAPHKPHAE